MGDNLKLWGFILLVPVFLAIGHDGYINFYKNDENRAKIEALQVDQIVRDVDKYKASDFGYLLVTYTPNLYDNLKFSVQEDTWRRWVDPVLSLYSALVAGFPAIIFFIGVLIYRAISFLGLKRLSYRSSTYKKDEPLNKRSKEEKYKYKRR